MSQEKLHHDNLRNELFRIIYFLHGRTGTFWLIVFLVWKNFRFFVQKVSRVLFSSASPVPLTKVLSLQKYWWLWYLLLLGFSLQTHLPRSDFIYAVLHNSLHDLQTAYDKHSEGVRHFKVWVWDFSVCSQNQCLRCSILSKYKLHACF